MKYEVVTLGKHYLKVTTVNGFEMYINGVLVDGKPVGYQDVFKWRGGTWIIDCWKLLSPYLHKVDPIYNVVFGYADDDTFEYYPSDVSLDSISGVNGQAVDITSIALADGQSMPIMSVYKTVDLVQYTIDNPLYLPMKGFRFWCEGLSVGPEVLTGFFYGSYFYRYMGNDTNGYSYKLEGFASRLRCYYDDNILLHLVFDFYDSKNSASPVEVSTDGAFYPWFEPSETFDVEILSSGVEDLELSVKVVSSGGSNIKVPGPTDRGGWGRIDLPLPGARL